MGVDDSGNDITLGHSSNPWQATVTIISSTHGATVSEPIAYFNHADGDNHAKFESN